MSFPEIFWQHVQDGSINNRGVPVPLNQGMAYTAHWVERDITLLWLPYEYTGLAYCNQPSGTTNICPYYQGFVIEEIEFSHGTDLHKPKTEHDFMRRLYHLGYELHVVLQEQRDKYPIYGAAPDYLAKMHQLLDWMRYYNSAKPVGGGTVRRVQP